MPCHYLKEKTNSFYGVSLWFILSQNPKKCIYIKKNENSYFPGTELKKNGFTVFIYSFVSLNR